ncbi:hypothetical protein EDD29_3298 [Actinocorallia herbida]|uniref:Uncharacterized protein n=1 Tax=Actinocorallia herbida TaxID=58109 RepID=A0A3N1CWR9_9ACTN|nr:hypothetical protein [Actinocorallia herbida]ROO85749.1 hypothetical protein EDD29_3298 [Actinocorallia herbida]
MSRRVPWQIIGGVLAILALVAAAALYGVFRSADQVRLALASDTGVVVIELPGENSGDCDGGACRSVLSLDRSDTAKKVRADVRDPLPEGVTLVYWGCGEGPGSPTCTITPDRDSSVCVTTTAPADLGRAPCGPVPRRPPEAAPTGKLKIALRTRWNARVSGGTLDDQSVVCANAGAEEKFCEIPITEGRIYYLRAAVDDPKDDPYGNRGLPFMSMSFQGCDSGAGHNVGIVCVVYGEATEKSICAVTSDTFETGLLDKCGETVKEPA